MHARVRARMRRCVCTHVHVNTYTHPSPQLLRSRTEDGPPFKISPHGKMAVTAQSQD